MTERDQSRLSFLEVTRSVLASFLGVQKNESRERDFTRGRARDFIIVGVIATVLFILVIFGIVQLVMSLAAK